MEVKNRKVSKKQQHLIHVGIQLSLLVLPDELAALVRLLLDNLVVVSLAEEDHPAEGVGPLLPRQLAQIAQTVLREEEQIARMVRQLAHHPRLHLVQLRHQRPHVHLHAVQVGEVLRRLQRLQHRLRR